MKKSKLLQNDTGLVSITVTLVIMIVVTLIVGSYALIVRREQRRALDSQLSTQAFYAAEAGVSDAQSALTAGALTSNITNCEGFTTAVTNAGFQHNSSVGQNVEYSCVLVNQKLKDWVKSSANPEDGAFIVPIKTDIPIDTLRIGWQEKTGSTDFATGFDRPADGGTLDSPMLRITIFSGANLSRGAMKASARTMFLAPVGADAGNVGSIQYSDPAANGAFVSGNCNQSNANSNSVGGKFAKHYCNVDITNLGGGTNYYVVVQPLYKYASVYMQGFGASDVATLEDSQAEIDVTGKAADVLRRIRVRVPIGEGEKLSDFAGIFPDAAISSTDSICKQWQWTDVNVEDKCPVPSP